MGRRLRCPCGNEVEAPAEAAAVVQCPACGRELSAAPAAGLAPVPDGAAAARAAAPSASDAPCPFCLELIQPFARKCPHCQEYLDPALAAERLPPPPISLPAVLSFLLGLISPFLLFTPGPLAVVLALTALLSRRKARGKGLAVSGLILGIVSTLALILVLAALATALSGMAIEPPPTGPSAEPLF